jgi:hypothetical protein
VYFWTEFFSDDEDIKTHFWQDRKKKSRFHEKKFISGEKNSKKTQNPLIYHCFFHVHLWRSVSQKMASGTVLGVFF